MPVLVTALQLREGEAGFYTLPMIKFFYGIWCLLTANSTRAVFLDDDEPDLHLLPVLRR